MQVRNEAVNTVAVDQSEAAPTPPTSDQAASFEAAYAQPAANDAELAQTSVATNADPGDDPGPIEPAPSPAPPSDPGGGDGNLPDIFRRIGEKLNNVDGDVAKLNSEGDTLRYAAGGNINVLGVRGEAQASIEVERKLTEQGQTQYELRVKGVAGPGFNPGRVLGQDASATVKAGGTTIYTFDGGGDPARAQADVTRAVKVLVGRSDNLRADSALLVQNLSAIELNGSGALTLALKQFDIPESVVSDAAVGIRAEHNPAIRLSFGRNGEPNKLTLSQDTTLDTAGAFRLDIGDDNEANSGIQAGFRGAPKLRTELSFDLRGSPQEIVRSGTATLTLSGDVEARAVGPERELAFSGNTTITAKLTQPQLAEVLKAFSTGPEAGIRKLNAMTDVSAKTTSSDISGIRFAPGVNILGQSAQLTVDLEVNDKTTLRKAEHIKLSDVPAWLLGRDALPPPDSSLPNRSGPQQSHFEANAPQTLRVSDLILQDNWRMALAA